MRDGRFVGLDLLDPPFFGAGRSLLTLFDFEDERRSEEGRALLSLFGFRGDTRFEVGRPFPSDLGFAGETLLRLGVPRTPSKSLFTA